MPWSFNFAGGHAPRFVPTPIVDRLMGAHAAMNILGSLQARTRTGRGQGGLAAGRDIFGDAPVLRPKAV